MGVGASPGHHFQHDVIAGYAEQAQADYQHAGDRAAAEGDIQCGGDAAARRFGSAHIGAYRNVHADVAGGTGKYRADDEADRGLAAKENADQHSKHDARYGDGGVLFIQVSGSAFLDGGGNAAHCFVAGWFIEYPFDGKYAENYCNNGADQRKSQTTCHSTPFKEKSDNCPDIPNPCKDT